MKFLALALATTIAVTAPAIAADPEARTLRRSTDAGREVRISTYSQHKSDCTPGRPPQISMGTKPAHGTTAIRPASVEGGKSRFGQIDCTGTVQSGLAIWYAPEAGFHGTDQFDFYVIDRNGTAHDTAIVDVK